MSLDRRTVLGKGCPKGCGVTGGQGNTGAITSGTSSSEGRIGGGEGNARGEKGEEGKVKWLPGESSRMFRSQAPTLQPKNFS